MGVRSAQEGHAWSLPAAPTDIANGDLAGHKLNTGVRRRALTEYTVNTSKHGTCLPVVLERRIATPLQQWERGTPAQMHCTLIG